MKRTMSCKVASRAALAILMGTLCFASLALAACGGATAQSSSSSASSSAASSSAVSSEASQSSAEQQLPECYFPVKVVTTFNDGTTQTATSKYGDRGKMLENVFEIVDPEGTYKIIDTYADWDNFGHYLKNDEKCDFGDGNPYTSTVESADVDVDEDGFATSSVYAITLNEQGLISKVSNMKVNGESYSTTAEVTYEKIDNPLQSGYEGWKNLTLINLITPLF